MKVNYWELAPGLTPERMSTLAALLAAVRLEALAAHEPHKGDSNWGFGCRVYDRSRNGIIAAAEHNDWLGIIDSSLHFVFSVGGVPIRFAHGDSEQPKARLLRRDLVELEAQQLAFDFGPEFIEARWRLIVETDAETMSVANVVLIQVKGDGEVLNSWKLGMDLVPASLRRSTPAAHTPAPRVRIKATQDQPSSVGNG